MTLKLIENFENIFKRYSKSINQLNYRFIINCLLFIMILM